MRRAPFVLGGTAGGLALLLSYHTSALSITGPQASRPSTAGSTPSAGAPPSPAGSAGTPAPGSPPSTVASGTNGSASAAPGGSATPGSGTASSPTAATTPTSAGAPVAPSPASAAPPAPTTTVGAQSFTGKQVSYQYGVLQVQITEQGGHITNVSEVVDQASDARSAQINSQAIPRLNQEALSAQSANIQAVSGATYTSDAYIQSLQSAIDQMG